MFVQNLFQTKTILIRSIGMFGIHETADGQWSRPHLITLKLVSNHKIRLRCLFSHILYGYAFGMLSLGISCKPRNLFLRLMRGPNWSFWANFGRLTSKIATFNIRKSGFRPFTFSELIPQIVLWAFRIWTAI